MRRTQLLFIAILIESACLLSACGGGAPPPPAVQLSVSALSPVTAAGAAVQFSVSALDASGAVATGYAGTVHFTSSDSKAVLPPDSKLTHGTGNFSVIFKTAGDQNILAADALTPSISGAGNVTVNPGPVSQLALTTVGSAATAAVPFSISVTALDAFMNVATNYMGTVHFTSSDPQASLPADTQLPGGSGGFAVTFNTIGPQTVTVRDTVTASLKGTSTAISVVSNAAMHLAISGPGSVTTRQTFSFSVIAFDAANNTATGYNGTVQFTSSDAQAKLPGSVTLVGGVSADVLATFESVGNGSQTITATDTATHSINGSAMLGVTAPATLTVSSGAPPAGSVGVDYGPSRIEYERCFFDFMLHGVNCTPCTPGPNGTCGNLPRCGFPRHLPCLEAISVFNGFTLMATGGVPGYSWSASGLPPGLTVDAPTGKILGTPTATGTFQATATVTDSGLPSVNTTASVTIMISPRGFQTTGNMTTARTLHAATLLGSGLVLVTGGELDANTLLATAEIFDPSAGTFAATGAMQISRSQHTATLLNDGRVLIAGGGTGTQGSATASAELYTASGSSSVATGSMIAARYGHTATLLNDGTVLILGGADATGTALASAEIFDPTNGTFTPTGNMQTARQAHTATLLSNGMVLVTGGIDANSKHLDTAELYDPTAKTFSLAAGTMTVTRANHTATLLTAGNDAGKVLLAGGADDNGVARNTAELFDPTAQSFTATSTMVSAHASHTATLLNDGTVLIVGGADATGNAVSVAELFDPASDDFSTTGSLVTAREQHTATLTANGRVLVTGGSKAGSAIASGEVY